MFSISVSVGSTAFMLLYRTEEKARANWRELLGITDPLIFTDDFGKEVMVQIEHLNGALFENHTLSQEGNIEISLHHARTQNNANKRAQSDPALRQPGFGNQPGVITPAGLNGGRQF